jgi:X-Pro dipeptidyl-peptidase
VLTDTCSSRLHTEDQRTDDPELLTRYQRYRTYLADEQTRLAGDYGDFWQARDYYTDHGDLKASALIVEGLNDENVRTKNTDLMRSALIDAGCEARVLFHQNAHVIPADEANHTDIMIGNHTYLEWLNRWFCHYLADVDNDVTDLASFTVQSNVDGNFYATENFDETEAGLTIKPAESGETHLSSEGDQLPTANLKGSEDIELADTNAACWTLPITQDVTIAGKIVVHLRMRTDALGQGDIGVSATLVDAADQKFMAFGPEGTPEEEMVEDNGATSTAYDLVRWKQDATKRKVITFSSMDLRNPEAGYEPASATTRPEPIEEKTHYDYTLWLDPTYYTVRAGHRLELYVIPSAANSFITSEEDRQGLVFTLERYGLSEKGIMDVGRDYEFTIANDQSYAEIPVAGQMRPLNTDE